LKILLKTCTELFSLTGVYWAVDTVPVREYGGNN